MSDAFVLRAQQKAEPAQRLGARLGLVRVLPDQRCWSLWPRTESDFKSHVHWGRSRHRRGFGTRLASLHL